MSHLTFGQNEFIRALYVSQVLLSPTGAIFRGVNNELTSCIHLYKELEGKKVEKKLTKENFTRDQKNWWEMC